MATFSQLPIERVREYWDQRPCNVRHSPLPVGTREYFDQVESRKYLVEPHIPGFAQFQRWAGKKVLEIGCGIGTDTVNFARAGAAVTAVELSRESLELARRRMQVYGLGERVRFFLGSAEELDSFLPRERFDLVYSFGVIHHTPHPERVIEQVREYIAPGGTLKIMVYHRYSWKVFWILMTYGKGRFWRLEQLVAANSEAQTGCPVTYTYSRRQASELLRAHGFEPTEVRVEHIFPYRVRDYVQYRYVKAWPWSWMPQRMFRWMERHFGWHLCVTAEAR